MTDAIDPERVRAVARGLTKAQREAVVQGYGMKRTIDSLLMGDPCIVAGVTYHATFARIRRFTVFGDNLRSYLEAEHVD